MITNYAINMFDRYCYLVLRVLIVRAVSPVSCRAIRVRVSYIRKSADTGKIFIPINTNMSKFEVAFISCTTIHTYGLGHSSHKPKHFCSKMGIDLVENGDIGLEIWL